MRSLSIYGGRFLGVEFRIHVAFLFLLAFLLLFPSAHVLDPGMIARSVALAMLVLCSVFLHEAGHVLAARNLGAPAKATVLLPLGGVGLADFSPPLPNEAGTLARELRLAAAGPLVNMFVAGVSGLGLTTFHPSAYLWTFPLITTDALDRSFFWINVFLFVVNLLPAFPLDGGRLLRLWFARRMDYRLATRRAVRIGHLFAAAFLLAGARSPWMMMVGLALFMAALLEERTVIFQSVVEAVRMEDIMLTHFSTLSPADTLEDALTKAVHSLQDDFPVVNGNDLVGVINRQTIVERLRREGNGYVQGAMNRGYEIASRRETLASAFGKLTMRGLTLIPVVDEERLVGIVTLQNMMHSMSLLAESRRLRKQVEEQS
jgi:Zn-dependent protease